MIKNFFNVAGADAVKRIAEWIRHKFYTKTEIDDMLSAGMRYEVVEELPATGEAGTFYLVPKQSAGAGDVYDEYIYVDGSFEHIGSTEIDLSNYYTKTQTDNLLGDKVDKESGKGLSTNDFTTAEKTKLGGIEAGAEVNVQSDWNQGDSTKDDFIKNKPTLRQPSTDGTAGQYLKSNGSGNAPSWETMDSSPTANSTKAVTSGGVKTALDGKQASISITTKTDDAGDNDKVIMQANGVTDTTTFVRRSLSNLLNWFRSKLDKVYFKRGDISTQIGSNYLFNLAWDNKFYCADVRFHVESHVYNMESGEEVTGTGMPVVKQFFDGNFAHYYSHPQTGEKQVVTITAASQTSAGYLFAYGNGRLLVCFYSSKTPNAISLRYKQRNSDTWMTANFNVSSLATNIYEANIPWDNSTHINTYEITIEGKTNAEVAYPGTSIAQIVLLCPENGQFNPAQQAIVNKYAGAQRIFGNVEMAKIIKTDGTSSQVLLANGDVMSLPVPVNKGGTGATTAIGAEYNILNQVANMDNAALSDDRRFAICNQTKSATNGVFRWYKLSALWTWIKTHFDSSPTSGSGNGITSGGVYSALEEKVNLQPDFTASQIDYSAGNVGKWQKVLRFPEGADLVINMKKTAMGSDSTSTLWFSSSSMGDSYTSLFGNHSVRFVHDGGYVFLVLACRKSTYEPIESYTFQIAHSSVPMSDIVAVTDASPITATPNEPNIIYRAPITTGAVSFNVNSSGAGSVSMSGHNDFLGNMTSEATNGVTVTMSGATEGQIYRFVFTRNITGGVTFKQSNVAYCTISGDVNAGDTITLTAVSNTADGWLYEQESAGIESSDGSNIVEYNGSTADVRVNWEKLPANVVRNGAYSSSTGHENIAIGFASSVAPTSYSGAVAIGKSTTSRGNFSIVVGSFSNADNGGMAFGVQAHANGSSSLAVGSNVTANDSNSMAIGYQTEAVGFQSIAIGPYASTKNISALAVGYNAKANQLRGGYGKHELISFNVNNESKKVYTSSTAETISIEIPEIGTFAGIDMYANYMLFVLNAELEFANELLFEVDGIVKQKQDFSSSAWNYISVSRMTALGSSGYYAYTFPSRYIDYSDINTSANAYFFATSGDSYNNRYSGISIGNSSVSIGSGNIAIGDGATSIKDGQVVIGQFNAESGTDLMQVGNGTETNRKNILTIDSNERLKVCSYVGETQTIEMNQQTGSLGNITKAVYRIRWDGTGEVTLTLNTSGCVEGQRVTIFAETNDVKLFAQPYIIRQGRFCDFMFLGGAWRPSMGIEEIVS